MSTRCPFAAWKPISANITHGGRQRIRGFVPHVQVGNGSLYGYFNTGKAPGAGASADFWCSKTGILEQYVDLADQSWAQGSKEHNGNPYMVSCEFEGFPAEPMTDAQIDKGGQLIAWVITDVNPFDLVVNTVPGNEGITPHHVFGGGHTCPGPGPREGQFPDLIDAANRWLHPIPIPTPVPLEDDMTPYPCQTSDGVYHSFAVKADGRIYETTWQAGQDDWSQPVLVANGDAPALARGGVGGICAGTRIDLFVIGPADAKQWHGYRLKADGEWVWRTLPGDYS